MLFLSGREGMKIRKSIPQLFFQPLDDVPHAYIFFHTGGDQLIRMDDGAVVPAAECLADIFQERSVRRRLKYMAIWRGKAMLLGRRLPVRSLTLSS